MGHSSIKAHLTAQQLRRVWETQKHVWEKTRFMVIKFLDPFRMTFSFWKSFGMFTAIWLLWVWSSHTRCRLLHGMFARILTHIFTILQWRPMDRNGDAWTLLNMVQNILMCDIYICICIHTNIHWIDVVWPHFEAFHFQKTVAMKFQKDLEPQWIHWIH